jgi:hypothetical protein
MSRMKHRLLFAVAATAALAAGLALASPAHATPPTHEGPFTIPYEFTPDCNPFGFNFENEVVGEEVVSVNTFYDSQGTPARVVVHDSFVETDTNSVTGKTLPFSGNRVETFDLIAGTRTVVGRSAVMTDPGRGIVIHDTGRVVFSAPFHVSFEAGPHDVLNGDVDQLACSALAAP